MLVNTHNDKNNADQLSRNFTKILLLMEELLYLGLGPNEHIFKFKPRKHLNILATFYLVGYSLCNVEGQKGYTGYANRLSNLVGILPKGFHKIL